MPGVPLKSTYAVVCQDRATHEEWVEWINERTTADAEQAATMANAHRGLNFRIVQAVGMPVLPRT